MDVEPGVWKEKTTEGKTVFRIMMTAIERGSDPKVFLHHQEFAHYSDAKSWGRKIAEFPPSNFREILNSGGDHWEIVTPEATTAFVSMHREKV